MTITMSFNLSTFLIEPNWLQPLSSSLCVYSNFLRSMDSMCSRRLSIFLRISIRTHVINNKILEQIFYFKFQWCDIYIQLRRHGEKVNRLKAICGIIKIMLRRQKGYSKIIFLLIAVLASVFKTWNLKVLEVYYYLRYKKKRHS